MSDFSDLRILLRTHQQQAIERVLNSHRVQQFDEAVMDAFLKRDMLGEFVTLRNGVNMMNLLRPSKSMYNQYAKEAKDLWSMQKIQINPEDIVFDELTYTDFNISIELVNYLKGINELWTPHIANLQDFKNQSLIKEIRKVNQSSVSQTGAHIAKMFADSMREASASLVILSKNFKALTSSIKKS